MIRDYITEVTQTRSVRGDCIVQRDKLRARDGKHLERNIVMFTPLKLIDADGDIDR